MKDEIFELAKQLEATIDSNIDMEEFIKAKYLFSDEKIKDCLATNTVQKTLREKVEELYQEIATIQEHNRLAILNQSNQGGGNEHMQSTQNQLVKALAERDQALTEVQDMQRGRKELQTRLAEVNKRLKLAKEKEESFNKYYEPKLRSTIEYQKTLQDGLVQIKEDTELLPKIFRAEAADRKNIKEAQLKAEKEAQEARAMRKTLEARIDDLTKERDRKTKLAMQAIAARHDIKGYLD